MYYLKSPINTIENPVYITSVNDNDSFDKPSNPLCSPGCKAPGLNLILTFKKKLFVTNGDKKNKKAIDKGISNFKKPNPCANLFEIVITSF